jgi:hypothetical protein
MLCDYLRNETLHTAGQFLYKENGGTAKSIFSFPMVATTRSRGDVKHYIRTDHKPIYSFCRWSRSSGKAVGCAITVSIPERARDYYVLHTKPRQVLGPNQPPIQRAPSVLSWRWRSRGMNLTTHLHLVLRLRMGGETSSFPLYAFIHILYVNSCTQKQECETLCG